ncbi:hypothetical protein CHISP_1852 [Chitinispirillum alkaliphilum]|nr:hypothetical protein CHISP_1852 [Chitinispirillum alkaliphilum]
MKSIIINIGLALGLLLVIGCGRANMLRPSQAEVDVYLEQNPELSRIDRECIRDGRFQIGISMQTLKFLMGEPNSIENVKQPWATQQHWTYGRGANRKVFIIEGENVVGILEN